MQATDIIAKKRDKQKLTSNELKFFVKGYTNGTIPDYQASAWCMTVLLNGISQTEATAYSLHLARSGDPLFTVHANDPAQLR